MINKKRKKEANYTRRKKVQGTSLLRMMMRVGGGAS